MKIAIKTTDLHKIDLHKIEIAYSARFFYVLQYQLKNTDLNSQIEEHIYFFNSEYQEAFVKYLNEHNVSGRVILF
jgi:hypothetical protein